MRTDAKITSKGQVTIPVEIRRELGLSAGDMVAFETREGYATLTKRRPVAEIMAELRDQYPELSQPPRYATKDEAIDAAMRERVAGYEDKERYGDELYLIGPHGTRVFGPGGEEHT